MLVYKQLLNYKRNFCRRSRNYFNYNKNEYHYESTWLHEASAGTINYEDLLYPVESAVKQDKVNFVVAEVTKIDRNAKRVETDKGVYDYDILVVALGFK